jgi:hypothetical protein
MRESSGNLAGSLDADLDEHASDTARTKAILINENYGRESTTKATILAMSYWRDTGGRGTGISTQFTVSARLTY